MPKTSSSSIDIVEASTDVLLESLDTGRPAANRGAGGSGRFGLPPYLDDGVPGRGLPLISAGSYETVDAGGLGQSVEALDGVQDRDGDVLPGDAARYGIYGDPSV